MLFCWMVMFFVREFVVAVLKDGNTKKRGLSHLERDGEELILERERVGDLRFLSLTLITSLFIQFGRLGFCIVFIDQISKFGSNGLCIAKPENHIEAFT